MLKNKNTRKDLLIFADTRSLYSKKLVKYLSKHKKIRIDIIIFSENSKKKKINEFKNLFSYKPIIFIDNQPHLNKSLINTIKSKSLNLAMSTSFPRLIHDKFLRLFSKGVINFHPSALPLNKGYHHSFWGIIDDTDHGATMHFMNKKFDAGDVIDQIKYKNSTLLTANDVFKKSHDLMLTLLKRNINSIISCDFKRKKQKRGNYHSKNMILKKSVLKINQEINVEFLWKLIRATKIKNHGYFIHDKKHKYKIISKFKRVN